MYPGRQIPDAGGASFLEGSGAMMELLLAYAAIATILGLALELYREFKTRKEDAGKEEKRQGE